ncbi:MAG TPA: hypothetical protein VF180_05115 [Acidimicrobiia bacterium]
MRRMVFMAALAALAALVLPVPSLAESQVGTDRRSDGEAQAVARSETFMLGGMPCSLIPVPSAKDPAPLGSGPCSGVRPGGRVLSAVGDCTMNFLFRASDGTRYIGTAGHCADLGDDNTFENSDNAGNGRIERIWPWGKGPVANDVGGQRIGEFVYAIVYAPKDFALIRLDPDVQASPEMCHFGTPRGVYSTTEAADAAVFLRYYGNGTGVSDVAPARTAVALGTPNPDHVFAAGLALPGDSGAGVMTADGLAVGVLVTTGVSGLAVERDDNNRLPAPSDLPEANEKGVDFGTMGITRLGPQLARATEKLGVTLQLITAG